MKNNYLNRNLRISADPADLNKLEAFIDQICDDFHVYDAYYGNIVASNNLVYEMCMHFANNPEFNFDLLFMKKASGMLFTLKVYDCYLDFAKSYEVVKDKSPEEMDTFNDGLHQMKMLCMLCDHILFNDDEHVMTLVFHVTGINDALTIQRIELLQRYFNKLEVGIKH